MSLRSGDRCKSQIRRKRKLALRVRTRAARARQLAKLKAA